MVLLLFARHQDVRMVIGECIIEIKGLHIIDQRRTLGY